MHKKINVTDIYIYIYSSAMLWFKRNNLINDEELAEIQRYLEKSDTLRTYNLYD